MAGMVWLHSEGLGVVRRVMVWPGAAGMERIGIVRFSIVRLGEVMQVSLGVASSGSVCCGRLGMACPGISGYCWVRLGPVWQAW